MTANDLDFAQTGSAFEVKPISILFIKYKKQQVLQAEWRILNEAKFCGQYMLN